MSKEEQQLNKKEESRFTILLEEMRGNFKAFGEQLPLMNEKQNAIIEEIRITRKIIKGSRVIKLEQNTEVV